jgi:2'-5' RNA ligase superfamily
VTSHFAVVVPFPGLADVVDEWRERTVVTKPSHGMPPHVTLLVPSEDDVGAIVEAMAGFAAFDVRFERLDRFPGTLWLAPDPGEPFAAMTEALVARWPERRPYGGVFARVIPHLTVAQRELDAAAAALGPFLPLQSRAEVVALYEKVQSDHWRELATVELEEN